MHHTKRIFVAVVVVVVKSGPPSPPVGPNFLAFLPTSFLQQSKRQHQRDNRLNRQLEPRDGTGRDGARGAATTPRKEASRGAYAEAVCRPTRSLR